MDNQHESPCTVTLITSRADEEGLDRNGVIFSSNPKSASNILKPGSKFGLSYIVRTTAKKIPRNLFSNDEEKPPLLQTTLGVLQINWKPTALSLPEGIVVEQEMKEKFHLNEIGFVHGPLPSQTLSILQLRGPQCDVECTPFHAELSSFPPSPKVGIPFELEYCITNKTQLNQKLSVSMSETSAANGSQEPSNGILVSGLITGDVQLGPMESKTLCYTGLAMRAGKTPMPALTVISSRYQSWVINDAKYPRFCHVLP